jgi:hypothetical protein
VKGISYGLSVIKFIERKCPEIVLEFGVKMENTDWNG